MTLIVLVLAYTLDLDTYRNLADGETSSNSQIISVSLAIIGALMAALVWWF